MHSVKFYSVYWLVIFRERPGSEYEIVLKLETLTGALAWCNYLNGGVGANAGVLPNFELILKTAYVH